MAIIADPCNCPFYDMLLSILAVEPIREQLAILLILPSPILALPPPNLAGAERPFTVDGSTRQKQSDLFPNWNLVHWPLPDRFVQSRLRRTPFASCPPGRAGPFIRLFVAAGVVKFTLEEVIKGPNIIARGPRKCRSEPGQDAMYADKERPQYELINHGPAMKSGKAGGTRLAMISLARLGVLHGKGLLNGVSGRSCTKERRNSSPASY